MKSSGPVFSRKNPFQPAPKVGKTHYHPSSNQSQTKKKKKTALSPVRLNRQPTPNGHTLNPKGKQSSETHENHVATTEGQPDYAELWPSSPASSVTSSDMEIPKVPATAGKSTLSFELGRQEDSVLAKYIERFRHGRPQSREERQVMTFADGEEQLPFWWMSPSSVPPSSTPSKTTDADVIQALKDDHRSDAFGPAAQRQTLSPCRRSLSGEFEDREILYLQERASRLLLRGESTLSDGSAPVSSEGLGCSDFSSPITVDEPVQRALIPSFIQSATVRNDSDPARASASTKCAIRSLVTPTRPEEDILFQWRLRRKMEQAKECSQSIRHASLRGPAFSWQHPSLSLSSAIGLDYKQQRTHPPEIPQNAAHTYVASPQPDVKEASGSFPPVSNPPFSNNIFSGSSVSQPQTIPHVPAHMHLLCDVLPCPVQASHASAQPRLPQTSDESQAQVVQKKTLFHSNEEPTLERVSSSPPASPGAVKGELPSYHRKQERNKKDKIQTKEERSEKKMSVRKPKKSSRSFTESEHSDGLSSTKNTSHQRLPKKVISWTETHPQQGVQEFPRKSCASDHVPPPSPVHSALGQVVSEILFPTVDSSAAQKTPVSLASPPETTPAPSQSPVPPSSAQNSVEVISQLLQEAEDSDAKEFDDDPLLQVLRKQRTLVKKQISEVDSILNEFLDEQQVT